MTIPKRIPSLEPGSEGNIRKRVCKACDRCRLKKTKCDGVSPCSRCKADNAICFFGVRKRPHDKVYPKGYAEMLEQQQFWLIAGLRELYSRLQKGESWPGAALQEQQCGHPLTHDILQRLNLFYSVEELPEGYNAFEEDCQRMQQELLKNGASFITTRKGSVNSEQENSSASSICSTLLRKPSQTSNIETQMQQSPFFQRSHARDCPLNPARIGNKRSADPIPEDVNVGSLESVSQFDSQIFDMSSMPFDQFPTATAATANSMSNSSFLVDWIDPGRLEFDSFIDSMGN